MRSLGVRTLDAFPTADVRAHRDAVARRTRSSRARGAGDSPAGCSSPRRSCRCCSPRSSAAFACIAARHDVLRASTSRSTPTSTRRGWPRRSTTSSRSTAPTCVPHGPRRHGRRVGRDARGSRRAVRGGAMNIALTYNLRRDRGRASAPSSTRARRSSGVARDRSRRSATTVTCRGRHAAPIARVERELRRARARRSWSTSPRASAARSARRSTRRCSSSSACAHTGSSASVARAVPRDSESVIALGVACHGGDSTKSPPREDLKQVPRDPAHRRRMPSRCPRPRCRRSSPPQDHGVRRRHGRADGDAGAVAPSGRARRGHEHRQGRADGRGPAAARGRARRRPREVLDPGPPRHARPPRQHQGHARAVRRERRDDGAQHGGRHAHDRAAQTRLRRASCSGRRSTPTGPFVDGDRPRWEASASVVRPRMPRR